MAHCKNLESPNRKKPGDDGTVSSVLKPITVKMFLGGYEVDIEFTEAEMDVLQREFDDKWLR